MSDLTADPEAHLRPDLEASVAYKEQHALAVGLAAHSAAQARPHRPANAAILHLGFKPASCQ